MGIGAMCTVMLKLPFTSTLLATLLLSATGWPSCRWSSWPWWSPMSPAPGCRPDPRGALAAPTGGRRGTGTGRGRGARLDVGDPARWVTRAPTPVQGGGRAPRADPTHSTRDCGARSRPRPHRNGGDPRTAPDHRVHPRAELGAGHPQGGGVHPRMVGLSLVVVIAVDRVGDRGQAAQTGSTAPSDAVLVVKIAIGVALVAIAFRQQRRTGRPEEAADLDGPARPAVRLDGRRPRPAAPTLGADRGGSGDGGGAPCVVDRVLLPAGRLQPAVHGQPCWSWSSTRCSPPRRPRSGWTASRAWIDTHRDQAIVVLSLVVGLWLVGDSLYLIVT